MFQVVDFVLLDPPLSGLSYLAVSKFWIVVETPSSRSEIDRNLFVPVCGHRPGRFLFGCVWFGAELGPKIDDFWPDSQKLSGPF